MLTKFVHLIHIFYRMVLIKINKTYTFYLILLILTLTLFIYMLNYRKGGGIIDE